MKLRWFFLFQAACLATFADEAAVELKAVSAYVSYIYMHVECVADSDEIREISVTWVAPGSTAEKSGLRQGDRLISINGVPVVGKKRSEVMNKSGHVAVRGTDVTFVGQRGFFRKNWSLTASIDAQGKMEPKAGKKEQPE
jgi:C-terminal processing protease CtpA/Prc